MSPNSVVLNNGVKIHGESHSRPLRNRKISNRKYYYIALKLEDKKKRAVHFFCNATGVWRDAVLVVQTQ